MANRLHTIARRYAQRFAEVRLGTPASLVFGLVAVGRGSSYASRPPDEVASVEGLVAGGWVPYAFWGAVLMLAGAVAAVLTILEPDAQHRRRTSDHRFTTVELGAVHAVGIAHTLLACCYLNLALSGFSASLLNGLPWSAVAGSVVAAGIHGRRIEECFDTLMLARARRRLTSREA